MKKLHLIFLLLILSVTSYGQQTYYATDRVKFVGIELIDGGRKTNAKVCKVKQKDSTLVFTPGEIQEYLLPNGRFYVSKKITVNDTLKGVFLETLSEDAIDLYYYRGDKGNRFFVELENGELLELSEENYQTKLDSLMTVCYGFSKVITSSGFSRNGLKKLSNRYNYCISRPFLQTRFGVQGGIHFMKPFYEDKMLNLLQNDKGFDYEMGYTFGVFLDQPIFRSAFSIHLESAFSRHTFISESENSNVKNTARARYSSVNFPFLLRYTLLGAKAKPFINLGGVASLSIENEIKSYSVMLNHNQVQLLDNSAGTLYSESSFGLSFGGGIEYEIITSHPVLFDIRYNYYPSSSSFPGRSAFQFLIGIDF